MNTINDSLLAFQTSVAHEVSGAAGNLAAAKANVGAAIGELRKSLNDLLTSFGSQLDAAFDEQAARLTAVAAQAREGRTIEGIEALPLATTIAVVERLDADLAAPVVPDTEADPEAARIGAMFAPVSEVARAT